MTELVASSAASLGHVVRVPPDAGAAEIVDELRPLRVDGVATFADDQLVRAAELAAGLGLRYTPPQAARTIRSKHTQRVALNDAGLAPVEAVYVPDPRRPPAELARLARHRQHDDAHRDQALRRRRRDGRGGESAPRRVRHAPLRAHRRALAARGRARGELRPRRARPADRPRPSRARARRAPAARR